LGDFGSREPGGGHLIQQGLEEVMVLAVNQCDAHIPATHAAAEFKSAKSSTQHHYMWSLC
jgi:hypothetical protein